VGAAPGAAHAGPGAEGAQGAWTAVGAVAGRPRKGCGGEILPIIAPPPPGVSVVRANRPSRHRGWRMGEPAEIILPFLTHLGARQPSVSFLQQRRKDGGWELAIPCPPPFSAPAGPGPKTGRGYGRGGFPSAACQGEPQARAGNQCGGAAVVVVVIHQRSNQEWA